jgi:hypothetical protein
VTRAGRASIVLASVALASGAPIACGGVKAPDLFLVQRSGSVANARLTLLVDEEGGVRCNGRARAGARKLELSDSQLV